MHSAFSQHWKNSFFKQTSIATAKGEVECWKETVPLISLTKAIEELIDWSIAGLYDQSMWQLSLSIFVKHLNADIGCHIETILGIHQKATNVKTKSMYHFSRPHTVTLSISVRQTDSVTLFDRFKSCDRLCINILIRTYQYIDLFLCCHFVTYIYNVQGYVFFYINILIYFISRYWYDLYQHIDLIYIKILI